MGETRGEATRLRGWRAAQGLSLQEVADLTGVSAATLSRLERGVYEAPRATRVLIARRLGVRIAELFEVEPLLADAG